MDAHRMTFRGAVRMLRKSASRIVASRHLVKKSLRLASILFRTSLRRIDSGSPFFTYALSMDYVLGFDGGGTKTECVLMDEAGMDSGPPLFWASNPSRVGVESATREIEKAADLSLQKPGCAKCGRCARRGIGGHGEAGDEGADAGVACKSISGRDGQHFYGLEMALAAAGEGPVIVLVAGTGSAAIGRNAQGQVWAHGGARPALGDDGSAF